MNNFVKLTENERKEVFNETAKRMKMKGEIVEKDFWVSYILNYLFSRSKWRDCLAFKGGTSLSKSFRLIERFSEDIDLIIDWQAIGIDGDEPWKERSTQQQNLFNTEANRKAALFLKNEFMPELEKDIKKELNDNSNFSINDHEPLVVNYNYEKIYNVKNLLPTVRLEMGPLGEWIPTEFSKVSSYVSDFYPQFSETEETEILTVSPERTFWEKAIILHKEAHREPDKQFPSRLSRHYYDLYCMYNSPVKEAAFNNVYLLKNVVDFNQKFYHCKWAKYEEAKAGNLILLPPEYNIPKLEHDYKEMEDMFYGKKPSFSDVLATIKALEWEISDIGLKLSNLGEQDNNESPSWDITLN
ncbi:MAG: nucleotidyl transferase AbiEii/AbiGii toxin family protein [Clostridiales bacterium]|nr:nucleotidyl transferase AbiEii/AbiGii toxin family protein [Clostridiales bacterium]